MEEVDYIVKEQRIRNWLKDCKEHYCFISCFYLRTILSHEPSLNSTSSLLYFFLLTAPNKDDDNKIEISDETFCTQSQISVEIFFL